MCMKCKQNEKENCATLDGKVNKCAVCPGYSGTGNVRNVRLQCGSTLKRKAANNSHNDSNKGLQRTITDNEQHKSNCCIKYNKIIQKYFCQLNHLNANKTASQLEPTKTNEMPNQLESTKATEMLSSSELSSILSTIASKEETTEQMTPPISYKGSNFSEKTAASVKDNFGSVKLKKQEISKNKECINSKTDKNLRENTMKPPVSNSSSGYNRNISEKFQLFSSINEETTGMKLLKMQNLAKSQNTLSKKKISDKTVSEKPQPKIQKTANPECQKCCKYGSSKVKQLFDSVQETPITIIEEYKKSTGIKLTDKDNNIEFTKEFPFLLTKTHGEPTGEAKYHFLMVDEKTNTSSKIDTSTITAVEKQSSITQSLAALTHLVDDTKREMVARKSKLDSQENNTEPNTPVPQSILIKANEQSDDQKEISKTGKASDNKSDRNSGSLHEDPSRQNLLVMNDREQKKNAVDEKFDFDFPSPSDDKPTTSKDMNEKKSSIDLQLEDFGDSSGRRVSISWTKDVEHDSPPERENTEQNERRASQVSWIVENDKTEFAEVRKKDFQPRKSTKGSLLDQILKEERLKNVPRKKSMLITSNESFDVKEKDKRLSIVVNTMAEPQKKKCCGLFRKKKQKTNMKASKSGQSKSSKSSKTLRSMQRLDSDSSESSDISFEKDDDKGSRRSSTESYQKEVLP